MRKVLQFYKDNLSKIELYVISLWLLFLLIIIITVDIPIYFSWNIDGWALHKWHFLSFSELLSRNVIPLISLFLLLWGIICCMRFKYRLSGSKKSPFKVKIQENVNYEHLTFLTTYIIPLICFDLSKARYAIVLMILLVIIGVIYVKTDMFYSNPTLALLGFHIYKVVSPFDNKKFIILITKDKLVDGCFVCYKQLDDRIYYAKINKE